MTETHVISALTKRRSDLMGEIEHTQLRVRKLLDDLDHLDATIRQMPPLSPVLLPGLKVLGIVCTPIVVKQSHKRDTT